MPVLAEHLAGPIVLSLGYTLLHFLWQGLVVAAVAMATLSAMRRSTASSRYCVLLALFGVLTLLPVSTCSLMLRRHHEVQTAPAANLADSQPRIDDDLDPPSEEFVKEPVSALPSFQPAIAREIRARSTWDIVQSWTRRHLTLFVVTWATGVCLLSFRLIVSGVGVVRVRWFGLSTTSTRIQTLYAAICAGLPVQRTVRIFESTLVQVPAVAGFLSPMILLPARLVTRLSDDQLRAILAHELAHIRRHDYLVNIVQIIVENFLFYHPAVWWLSRRIRQEREHCCDDFAADICGGKVVLARALAALAELNARTPYTLPAATGGSIVNRIRRLVHTDAKPDQLVAGGLGFGTLCVTGLVLVVSLIMNSAKSSENEENKSNTPEKAGPAEPPQFDPSQPIPFEVLYRIPEGRVLHRVSFGWTPEAKKRYEAKVGPEQVAAIPEGPTGKIWNFDGKKTELKTSAFGGQDGIQLTWLVDLITQVRMCELEGDANLWVRKIIGDFVVDSEATPAQLIGDLEQILNSELNFGVTLRFEDVERDVFVAKGKFVAKPAGPLKQFQVKPRPTYLVYGAKQDPNPLDNMGDYAEFWKAVSLRAGRPIVDESENAPEGLLQWLVSYDKPETTVWSTIPPKQFSANAELVLKRVSQQTGLKFEKAKRKIRVLRLERDPLAQAAEQDPGNVAREERSPIVNRNPEIDAAIRRLRSQQVFVREFHPRNDPRYWVQIQIGSKRVRDTNETSPDPAAETEDPDIFRDIEIVSRGAELDFHLNDVEIPPESLKRLSSARVISTLALSGWSVNDDLLAVLPKLRVTGLHLGEGPYTDDGIKQIADCDQLQSISLGGSSITDDCFNTLGRLTKLKSVSLSSPSFTPDVFATLKKVHDLETLNVRTKSDLLFQPSDFPKLRRVDLSGKAFDDDFVQALAENCPLLEQVYLRNSSISNDGVSAFVSLKHLTTLALDRSQIDDDIADSIRQMPNLTWLDLNGCPVGDATLAAAANCVGLRHLDLGQTNITDDGLAVVSQMKNMQYISLWPNTQLTDSCIAHLRQLPNYAEKHRLHVQLERTSITADGIRDLQEALPNATIRSSR